MSYPKSCIDLDDELINESIVAPGKQYMPNATLSMSKATVVGTSEWSITVTEDMFAVRDLVSY